MVFLRKAFASALLLTVALLSVTTSAVQAGSSHVAGDSTFGPRSRMPLVDGDKKHSLSSARLSGEKEASLASQKSLSVRGGVANTYPNAILGAAVFAVIENGVKRTLKAADLNFPAQLASCIFLFAFLLLTEAVSPELANGMFSALTPGAGILAKWLPVFFVPALVMLPLSPSIGSSFEILKVVLVASLGFLYTLTTVTYSVLAVQKATGSATKIPASTTSSIQKPVAKAAPAKAYSDYLASSLFKITVVAGILSLISTSQGFAFDTPLRTVFLGAFTVFAYVWGARLPPSFTKVVHPLVTSSGVLLGSIALLAKLTGVEFLDYLRYYKSGSLNLTKAGPGDILLYLLGPSVVSFAISMYSRRHLLKTNLPVVVTAMLMSSVGGLFGTAAFVRMISLGGKGGSMVRLSVLARNVTTALSMALTAMIGGDISIAASVVVLTGIIGATYGKTLLTALGVTDPICRGLAIGCSSQGLGVASISDEPDAFPFAAISMVLTAVSATTLVSIPVVKTCLIKLATGN